MRSISFKFYFGLAARFYPIFRKGAGKGYFFAVYV